MPMKLLTAEDLAEIRKNVSAWEEIRQPGPWTDVKRLLDEVEQTRAGAVVIRLEEGGKSVPFGDAVLEVVGKYQALLKRAREELHVGLGGIPLGRNTDELIREIDALLG